MEITKRNTASDTKSLTQRDVSRIINRFNWDVMPFVALVAVAAILYFFT